MSQVEIGLPLSGYMGFWMLGQLKIRDLTKLNIKNNNI